MSTRASDSALHAGGLRGPAKPGSAIAVLTREPVDAQGYASALAPLGLDVLAMPVTKTVAADDPAALSRALASGTYDAIVVASPRAAHELARAAAGRESPLPEIWAVGAATRRALQIAKLAAHHPPDVRDGIELAQRLVASRSVAGKRVLVPRAEEGRVEPLELLRHAGATVVDVVAYRTQPTAAADPAVQEGAVVLAAGGAAVCAVFAPSQVSALSAIMASRGHALSAIATAFCAIGQTTAGALREAGIARIAIAAAPTPEGMAQAVRSVYPPKA